jgi:hypothetical protein
MEINELHPEGRRNKIQRNWPNIFIGLMLLINNIIIISVIFYVIYYCKGIGSDVKKYFDNYILHVSFV